MDKLVAMFLRYRSFLVPAGILACLVVVLVPMPAAMVDILLVANIALSLERPDLEPSIREFLKTV